MLQLKDVPLENDKRQPLQVCGQCEGGGVWADAEKDTTDRKGEQIHQTRKAKGKLIDMLRRNGWSLKMHQCEACKGAGMIVVGGSK